MHLYCLNVKRQMVQMKLFDPGVWTYCACTPLYLTLLRASLHDSEKADVADELFCWSYLCRSNLFFMWHQALKLDPTLQLFPFVEFLKHL